MVHGLDIAYSRAGSGSPLILLHGIGGNVAQWRNQLEGFSDEFTVIAWDAPGYGGSSDPTGAWLMADYAEYLAGFLDAFGLERAHVLGQSWGGMLAQELYRRHPERVRSLILSDTSTGGRSQPEEQRLASLNARLHALDTMTPAEMARARAPVVLGPEPSEEVRAETEAMLAQIRPAGYRQAAIALSEVDTRDVLPTINAPTLVIAGEHDRVIPPGAAAYLRDHIPGAKLVTIPNAGHLPGMEQSDAYNAAVREFLRPVVSSAR